MDSVRKRTGVEERYPCLSLPYPKPVKIPKIEYEIVEVPPNPCRKVKGTLPITIESVKDARKNNTKSSSCLRPSTRKICTRTQAIKGLNMDRPLNRRIIAYTARAEPYKFPEGYVSLQEFDDLILGPSGNYKDAAEYLRYSAKWTEKALSGYLPNGKPILSCTVCLDTSNVLSLLDAMLSKNVDLAKLDEVEGKNVLHFAVQNTRTGDRNRSGRPMYTEEGFRSHNILEDTRPAILACDILERIRNHDKIQFEHLLCQKSKAGQSPLISAILALNFEAAKTILRMMATSACVKEMISIQDANGFNALHHAVDAGAYELLDAILACRIDINMRDKRGNTALHVAAYRNCVCSINVLIAHKASIDTSNGIGRTPLFKAIEADAEDAFDLLVANNANIFHFDSQAISAMSLCVGKKKRIYPPRFPHAASTTTNGSLAANSCHRPFMPFDQQLNIPLIGPDFRCAPLGDPHRGPTLHRPMACGKEYDRIYPEYNLTDYEPDCLPMMLKESINPAGHSSMMSFGRGKSVQKTSDGRVQGSSRIQCSEQRPRYDKVHHQKDQSQERSQFSSKARLHSADQVSY